LPAGPTAARIVAHSSFVHLSFCESEIASSTPLPAFLSFKLNPPPLPPPAPVLEEVSFGPQDLLPPLMTPVPIPLGKVHPPLPPLLPFGGQWVGGHEFSSFLFQAFSYFFPRTSTAWNKIPTRHRFTSVPQPVSPSLFFLTTSRTFLPPKSVQPSSFFSVQTSLLNYFPHPHAGA